MKVIDLLNKIANGEEDRLNNYQFSQNDYCTIDEFFNRYILDEENLNLEIIEDTPKDKKIKKLKLTNGGLTLHKIVDEIENDYPVCEVERSIIFKINEIIDKINGEENGK